ncbi:MAG: FMN-binding protein [Streptosporangiaceae bacterium]
MRRAILALSSTVAGLILLLSFKTHVPGAAFAGTAAASGSGGPAAGAGSADMAGAGHASNSARPSRPPHRRRSRVRTVTGTVASTPYGPMQVRLTLAGQAITRVTVLQRTDDGAESNQVDANAIPKLVGETLAVQSARINAVSGASYTSAGYRRSLQSALDQAGA